MIQHQYIERETLDIKTESLYCDRLIHFLYSTVRENAPAMFKIITGARFSSFISFLAMNPFWEER